LHRQSCDALDEWRGWLSRFHADPILTILHSFKKRFLQSKVDSKAETKRKLNFATQFVFYVNHELAQKLKRLNSKVSIQERK
jgi:hypothetical protein